MARYNDPKLLYSVGNIHAYHIQDGKESPLGNSGPQTLSLLMVPTSSPFSDLSSTEPTSSAPEEDFYLHLHLPPELDLSLPATTQIYHQPPRSYLIPRWDLGPESGAFTRIEFPKLGNGPDRVTQEDVDTFETILAQCTAFLERAKPPVNEKGHNSSFGYNPAEFAPGEGYVGTGEHGQIVLVDEEDGSVVGELGRGYHLIEGKDVHVGSKTPVEIELSQEGDGNQVLVTNASEEYLKMAKHPAYKDSALVQNAAVASRLIVTGSGWLANQMKSGADAFSQKTQPNPKPLTFTQTTQARVRKLNKITQGAVDISAKTIGQINRHAQNLGATMTRRGVQQRKSQKAGYTPGLLNKSIMAFSTVADGIDHASRHLLASGSSAATQVVGHRYGEDAGHVAGSLVGGVRNVGLVYVDAAGVSRRAVLKSVAKGMVVGKAPGGEDIVVGGNDGGAIPPEVMPRDRPGVSNDSLGAGSGQQVGFGNAAPLPEKAFGTLGEPLG